MKRIKPNQLVVGIGVAVALFTVASGISATVFGTQQQASGYAIVGRLAESAMLPWGRWFRWSSRSTGRTEKSTSSRLAHVGSVEVDLARVVQGRGWVVVGLTSAHRPAPQWAV